MQVFLLPLYPPLYSVLACRQSPPYIHPTIHPTYHIQTRLFCASISSVSLSHPSPSLCPAVHIVVAIQFSFCYRYSTYRKHPPYCFVISWFCSHHAACPSFHPSLFFSFFFLLLVHFSIGMPPSTLRPSCILSNKLKPVSLQLLEKGQTKKEKKEENEMENKGQGTYNAK